MPTPSTTTPTNDRRASLFTLLICSAPESREGMLVAGTRIRGRDLVIRCRRSRVRTSICGSLSAERTRAQEYPGGLFTCAQRRNLPDSLTRKSDALEITAEVIP